MLRLRKIEPTDLPYLYQWENDARMWADSDTHNPLSQADLREYIASTTGDIYRDGQLRLMIEDEGVTLGCIDLFDFDARNRKAAIGMYIAPHARGKGVGKLIFTTAMSMAKDMGYNHLYFSTYNVLKPARNMYRNLGFVITKETPEDEVLPGAVEEIWEKDI